MLGTCTDTVFKTIKVYGPIKSYFKYTPHIVCPYYSIQFTDSSYGRSVPVIRKWDFGDGTPIVYGTNVSHAYTTPGAYNVTLVVINAQGCSDTSFQIINVLNPLPANFAINAPALSCRNSVAFSANYSAPTYLWSFGEPSSPFNTSSFSNPTHAYVNSGFYTVTLVANPGTGCADTAVHVVSVQFGLQAGFDTAAVCIYDSAAVQQQTLPGPVSLIKAVWYWGDGDSTLALTHDVKHLYQNAGTYQINMVVTNSWGCQDSIKLPINIYPRPVINIGTPASVCNLDTVQLSAHGGGTYLWSPNYAIDSIYSATPRVTPDKTTSYQVKVISPLGCFDTANVLITSLNPPSRGTVLDSTICFGDSARLLGGSNVNNYLWSPNYNLSANNIGNPWAFPLVPTQYVVHVTNGTCIHDDTFKVNVAKLAVPNAGQDTTICKGATANLRGTGGVFYSWTPNENMSFSNTATPVVYPSMTTTYVLTVIDTFSCLKPISDIVTVHVEDFNWAYAGEDTSGIKGVPIELHAEGGVSYSWQPIYGLDNPTVQNPSATLDKDMTYVVTVTSANGCIDHDTINVIIFPEITAYIPNAFTPNGDGVDDVFIPIYAGVTGLMEFAVYNRWGNKVFSTTDRNEGWDGHFKGQDAETGAYVWVIRVRDLTGAEWLKKGDVTLIR
jgi:gliding motility-associated-like protein